MIVWEGGGFVEDPNTRLVKFVSNWLNSSRRFEPAESTSDDLFALFVVVVVAAAAEIVLTSSRMFLTSVSRLSRLTVLANLDDWLSRTKLRIIWHTFSLRKYKSNRSTLSLIWSYFSRILNYHIIYLLNKQIQFLVVYFYLSTWSIRSGSGPWRLKHTLGMNASRFFSIDKTFHFTWFELSTMRHTSPLPNLHYFKEQTYFKLKFIYS